MPDSVMPALQQTLFSGYIGEGPRVAQFERALADWLAVPDVVTVNSGTSALHLALHLAGVGPGDEVISSPQTCVATHTPVVALGGRMVWADIDPWTGNISAADVAAKCSERTKAIIAVHWGGYPCDLAELAAIAHTRGIALIEDAAHALGSRYQGLRIGAHGDFVCFSFQAIKLLTTVDGGALVCKSREMDARARRLRWFGLDRHYMANDECRWDQDLDEAGYKFHMNDVAATIGLEQLNYLDANLARHQANAAHFDAALHGFRHIRPLLRSPDRSSAHWLYTVRVKQRQAFFEHMRDAGIACSRVHVRNDRYRAFGINADESALSGVARFDAEQISIPCGWWIGDAERRQIVQALQQFEAVL
ncbi:DegT/DnrJ/EryC1/StrS family aminotransferase [Chitinimonas sp.]|uniref:DegT/DnrJ/EryC1/StrS family aminotransferase n=1 Tax=Chitinimonas sp. TaxID=1934313 RepID=UPI0035B3F16A